jgi:DNA-binding response OmpR family regulator
MKLKVLVADDERVIADTLALILKQNGFEATAVYSGEEAIETTKTFQPDVLISDVVMFGLNGIDAAIEIRKILPNCKVLLLSGQSSTADLLDEASGRGHDFEIVAKPIPPSALLARLEELIHGPDEAEVAS